MALHIKAEGIDEAYRALICKLIKDPDFVDTPRNGPMNEVLSASIEIANPRKRVLQSKARGVSLRYLAGETAFYLSGSESLDFIAHYAAFWRKISDDGMTVNSCYGKRLFQDRNGKACISQYDYAKTQLEKSKASRKAVMMIYGPRDLLLDTKDNACTIYLQFFIRENRLFAEANMRSNDIWLGTPYDIFFFTLLQDKLLFDLKKTYPELEMGTYVHHAGSLHLYHKHLKQANEVAKEEQEFFPFAEFKWDEETEKGLASFLLFESALRLGKAEPLFIDTFCDNKNTEGSALLKHLAFWLTAKEEK
jgi:thymidylate synthase